MEAPHPFITRRRLREILAPEPGGRVLEVGPGTCHYALPVAGWLEPGGTLGVLDLQQEMLDHVAARARENGLSNIVPARGDATALPYPDASFDAAYLTVVLGEIPDEGAALRELGRVLKPGGRLVAGKILVDPHYVPFPALRERPSGLPSGYNAHALSTSRRAYAPVALAVLVAAFVALYPYLDGAGLCVAGGCPEASGHAQAAGFSAVCLVAVLAASRLATAAPSIPFLARRTARPCRPREAHLPPETPPPRTLPVS